MANKGYQGSLMVDDVPTDWMPFLMAWLCPDPRVVLGVPSASSLVSDCSLARGCLLAVDDDDWHPQEAGKGPLFLALITLDTPTFP